MNNNQHYTELRNQYPVFTYSGFDIQKTPEDLTVTYHFNIAEHFFFSPSLTFHTPKDITDSIPADLLKNMIFHIGLVEMISYWKITCAPTINICSGKLSNKQSEWWKKLMYKGLGEFFYVNGIHVDATNFVNIQSSGIQYQRGKISEGSGYLIPVGGGKDSVVTLELLKNKDATPFIINPREAQLSTVAAAGYDIERSFRITRRLDPLMLKLNNEGFLNGHTPFSALLAFTSLPAALFAGRKNIALSNESSANESTVHGSHVNHQYSKSLEFENDFRGYIKSYITEDLRYFSMLRPLSEVQIAKIFSHLKHHHAGFRSCNVGSKTNSWCGKCPKCMFTAIMLSLFLPEVDVTKIFNKNLFKDAGLVKTTEELAGLWPAKPFECVGTAEEVTFALRYIIINSKTSDLPVVLNHLDKKIPSLTSVLSDVLDTFDKNHNLTLEEFDILKKAVR